MLRSCAYYLVALWLIIQISDVLLPSWGISGETSTRYLLISGVCFLPLIAVAAWFYQITPQGVRRNEKFVDRRIANNIHPLNDRRAVSRHRQASADDYAWKIEFASGPLQGLSYPVNNRLLIGRADECDISLTDPHLSRQHLRLSQSEDDCIVLEDLNSANGTLVNGEKVVDCLTLQHDDEVSLGDVIFVIERVAQALDSNNVAASDATVFVHSQCKQDAASGTG